MPTNQKDNNSSLYRYIGLTTQIMGALAIGVFAGWKLDKWFNFSIPLLIWILPLLIIVGIIWQVIKDTTKK